MMMIRIIIGQSGGKHSALKRLGRVRGVDDRNLNWYRCLEVNQSGSVTVYDYLYISILDFG